MKEHEQENPADWLKLWYRIERVLRRNSRIRYTVIIEIVGYRFQGELQQRYNMVPSSLARNAVGCVMSSWRRVGMMDCLPRPLLTAFTNLTFLVFACLTGSRTEIKISTSKVKCFLCLSIGFLLVAPSCAWLAIRFYLWGGWLLVEVIAVFFASTSSCLRCRAAVNSNLLAGNPVFRAYTDTAQILPERCHRPVLLLSGAFKPSSYQAWHARSSWNHKRWSGCQRSGCPTSLHIFNSGRLQDNCVYLKYASLTLFSLFQLLCCKHGVNGDWTSLGATRYLWRNAY